MGRVPLIFRRLFKFSQMVSRLLWSSSDANDAERCAGLGTSSMAAYLVMHRTEAGVCRAAVFPPETSI